MDDKLLEIITQEAHLEFAEHGDSPTGLSRDCERCRDFAMRLMIRMVHFAEMQYQAAEISVTRDRAVN